MIHKFVNRVKSSNPVPTVENRRFNIHNIHADLIRSVDGKLTETVVTCNSPVRVRFAVRGIGPEGF